MKRKIILFLSLLVFFITQTSFGYDKTEIKLVYDRFYIKLEKQIKNTQKIITQLESLDKKISSAVAITKNQNKKQILNELLSLNTSKINLLIVEKMKQNIQNQNINSHPFLGELINAGYKNIILNDAYEYTQNGTTYRFMYKKYFSVDKNNYTYFITNKLQNAYIVTYKNSFFITNDFEIEKKYTYEELFHLFKNKLDYKKSYIFENEQYYTYSYNYYVFFEKDDGIYLRDLSLNKININTTLMAKNIDGTFFFSNDYKKVRLVNQKLIEGVSNKNEFLYNILDDNRHFEGNYDDVLLHLKSITENITKEAKNQEEKISIIYQRIVNNIDYYKDFTDGNKQVFSGIHTFQNKSGVCDGYTKVFSYMLSFAGVEDVEIKRGYAYDNSDFPNFGHAWVRIGKYYYDPTFDDPIGNTQINKTVFSYYKLPYELMYVNRFDGIDIPTDLKNLSLLERKKLVLKNMYHIYDSYKDYLLMAKIKNRKILGLNYNDEIDLNTLINKVNFYEVKNFSYYDETGKKYNISGLNYYPLDNSKLEIILFDANLNLSESKFFKWYDKDGKIEYRLAYNLKYY